MSRICVRYFALDDILETFQQLKHEGFEPQTIAQKLKQRYVFLEYATEHWGSHTKHSDNVLPSHDYLLEHFSWPFDKQRCRAIINLLEICFLDKTRQGNRQRMRLFLFSQAMLPHQGL